MRPFAYNYDVVYSDKDYDSEIGVMLRLIPRDSLEHSSVLEIGAGTGNHTLRLGSVFRRVVAVEIDEDFAHIARLKLLNAPNIQLVTTPVEDLEEVVFDAAVAFFNVLNYVSPKQMHGFLGAIAARLKSGSCFVTDLLNGEVVLADPPRPETRIKRTNDTEISQRISPILDNANANVELNYSISITRNAAVETFSEKLTMHLWHLDELTAILGKVGFREVQFWDRRKFPAPATSGSWHVWMRAIKS